jgi:Na+-translocating ferredoxin:NAD+ oxidoreductase RnfC subunit
MANPTKIQLQQKVRDLKEKIVKLEEELEAAKRETGFASKKQITSRENMKMQLHGGTVPDML